MLNSTTMPSLEDWGSLAIPARLKPDLHPGHDSKLVEIFRVGWHRLAQVAASLSFGRPFSVVEGGNQHTRRRQEHSWCIDQAYGRYHTEPFALCTAHMLWRPAAWRVSLLLCVALSLECCARWSCLFRGREDDCLSSLP